MRRPFGQFPYKFVQITSQSDGSPLKAVQGAAVVSTFTSGLSSTKTGIAARVTRSKSVSEQI